MLECNLGAHRVLSVGEVYHKLPAGSDRLSRYIVVPDEESHVVERMADGYGPVAGQTGRLPA